MLDLLIVIFIVAAVGLWLGRRWWRTFRGQGPGCGCGCGCGEGGCTTADASREGGNASCCGGVGGPNKQEGDVSER